MVSRDPKFIRKNKISHILVAAKDLQKHFQTTLSYKQLNLTDNPTSNISKYFVESIKFIEQSLEKGGCILVHCLGGKSRSASIITAYIMIKLELSFEDALKFVKGARSKADPNPGFVIQLKDFEKCLKIYFQKQNLEKYHKGKINISNLEAAYKEYLPTSDFKILYT